MNGKLKEILNQVQAGEALKNNTKLYLAKKTRGYSPFKVIRHLYCRYAVSCACLLLALLGGRWLYFTPTAEISIDINPSIELRINRFDRVIAVHDFNEDGQALLSALDIKYKKYEDALDQILNHGAVAALLSNNELMTITVSGPDESQSSKIYLNLESYAVHHQNTSCHYASSEQAASAHEAGLSCGKYIAFLEANRLDPSITPEMIQGMTMREIWDLIAALSAGSVDPPPSDGGWETGRHGHGHGHGGGHGFGKSP